MCEKYQIANSLAPEPEAGKSLIGKGRVNGSWRSIFPENYPHALSPQFFPPIHLTKTIMELKLSHSQPFCKNPRTGFFSTLKALKLKHPSISVALAAANWVATTVVPDDFRCPVSGELMRDPVVLATRHVSSPFMNSSLFLFFPRFLFDEFTKQAQEGNLGLGESTNILALALCKHERSGSQPSKLVVGSLDNIVAHGTMFEKFGPEVPLHIVPLGEANVCVSIDFVIQNDAILPVPIPGETYVVGDATGYHVAWPKNLILFGNEGASKNLAVDGNKATSSNVDSDKYLESLRSFDDNVATVACKEAFTITLDEDMFGANVECRKNQDNAKNMRRTVDWKGVEYQMLMYCPKQPSTIECGFFVMRFMKDLVANPSMLCRRDFNGKKTFTQAEIDEVRIEWMNFVIEFDI
ncbi:hypothetical protein RHMOL_Rhmol11G0016600 [Rhododendron molle]|uniref:Uncharacterized protein n=1 Tax=Rhododendron molle TaxID=49168 RepID=A0ACC0LNP9_RHOML|nr:hypothetical protein RHMOL_Rhmol11G0016600 [Rhododendron molle]